METQERRVETQEKTVWSEDLLGHTEKNCNSAWNAFGIDSKTSPVTEEWVVPMCCTVPRHRSRELG